MISLTNRYKDNSFNGYTSFIWLQISKNLKPSISGLHPRYKVSLRSTYVTRDPKRLAAACTNMAVRRSPNGAATRNSRAYSAPSTGRIRRCLRTTLRSTLLFLSGCITPILFLSLILYLWLLRFVVSRSVTR